MAKTISNLKHHLGIGLGLRKNKFLIEIPMIGLSGEKLDILTKSASLPERVITTTSIFHQGRKYNIRGETDYGGTYDVTIVDDSQMSLRKAFDKWLTRVDNSNTVNNGILSGVSYELELLDSALSALDKINQINSSTISDLITGSINSSKAQAVANYQTDINIWQLDATNNKIYGYKLQNAFPSNISTITYDDSDENTLSEFNVQFSFSEFIPIFGISPSEQVLRAIIGDGAINAIYP